jgi:N4-(beta-N-acetylglucosaminyl)-L-asparaginase
MALWSRRKFFFSTLTGSALVSAGRLWGKAVPEAARGTTALGADFPATRPLMLSSANGLKALEKGMGILKTSGDTLEAVVATVTIVEDDPNDDSVGYGGLPNEEGVVELDASVMHGPSRRAGSVASVQKIKNVSRLARTVMERTNHVMIVGDGARRFAVAEGFEEMNLLTDHSRNMWLAWKAKTDFNWRPGIDSPEWKQHLAVLFEGDPEKMAYAEQRLAHPPTGTINCLAVNAKGEVSGTTTTSGLAWKIPGRVGDSPVIGAGLYVDGEVGGAGSTGKGEENIKICGGHTIVEHMRRGVKPTEACLEVLGRVVDNYNGDKKKLAAFQLSFYAVNKDGEYGSAALWKATSPDAKVAQFAVHDGTQGKLLPCKPLFDEVAHPQD